MKTYLIIVRKFNIYLIRGFVSFLLSSVLVFGYVAYNSRVSGEFAYKTVHKVKLQTGPKSQNSVLGAKNVQNKNGFLDFETIDHRARVFDLYFLENNSPLYGHGKDFVAACDKYNTPQDCTLLPAIAKVETNLCKTDISASQYNCWGYGGSGENRIIYSSFEESIDSITGRLMNGYRTAFFEDPEIGELYYCGSHCHLWGDHVKEVQNQLRARLNNP